MQINPDQKMGFRVEGIDAKTPPFEAVEHVEQAIQRLDEWTTNFIGRMQPYCATNSDVPMLEEARLSADGDSRSPLEMRIGDSAARVAEITAALDRMNVRLRL